MRVVQVGKMHLDYGVKARVLAMSAIAKALYACEAVPLASRQVNSLRTCIANALVPGAARGRSPTLALATSKGVELDPLVLVPARRAMAMRRLLVKCPELKQEVAFIIGEYRRAGHGAVAEAGQAADGGEQLPEDEEEGVDLR